MSPGSCCSRKHQPTAPTRSRPARQSRPACRTTPAELTATRHRKLATAPEHRNDPSRRQVDPPTMRFERATRGELSCRKGAIRMDNAANTSTAGSSGQIGVAGAGYAGLHVVLRLTAKLRNHPSVKLTLVDQHDYHQVLTELPRVAGGTRAADAVRIPLQDVLSERVRFVETEINGFDLPGRRLLTEAGQIGWEGLGVA